MKKFSPLELLHPDGRAITSFVLGKNCPENLLPEVQNETHQKTELMIVAPSIEECKTHGWLESAATFIDGKLSRDGIVYILAPRAWRWKVVRLLGKMNFIVDSSFWHFPDPFSSHYIVPLEPSPAQFAVDEIIPVPSWKRSLARRVFYSADACRILAFFWNAAAISVRRTDARPRFQWLFPQVPEPNRPGTAIIRPSWRGANGATVLYPFSMCERVPSTIAKTAALETSSGRPPREAETLEELGPSARRAGARVPQILWKKQNDARLSLLFTFVDGQSTSNLLESNGDLLLPILAKLVDWLERWHRATLMVRPLQWEQVEQVLLAPLHKLAPLLQGSEGYRDWLVHRSQELVGSPIPLVATHNDLTMVNILLDKNDNLGIVDWETGHPAGWPLTDFYYAVTDAVRIVTGRPTWLEAFKACYWPDGAYIQQVASWQGRLQAALGVPQEFAKLCFHACWLHHASNEHQESHPDGPRPFFEMAQWLALNYSSFDKNRN